MRRRGREAGTSQGPFGSLDDMRVWVGVRRRMKLDRDIYKGEIKQLHYLIISRDHLLLLVPL